MVMRIRGRSIIDQPIATAEIAALSVSTAKIAADAVTGAKIADDQIDSEHIAAGAVDLEHMSANSIDSDQYVDGSIDNAHLATTGDVVNRSMMVQDDLKVYQIPLADFLAVDGAGLGASEDSADLFVVIASNVISLKGRTPQTTTEAASAYTQFSLPAEYVDGQTVTLRVKAQFINGSGADVSRTSSIDANVYEQAAGAVGSDICATAAQVFTADDTYETFSFTVTPTTLAAGDLLNILVTASAVADDANPTQIQIGEVAVLCDVKG
uniref:Uncharacterized protein n=1 Tax=viral metagenome TaxID=1070528 RepID=A0A6M3J2M2_9ZZZZ